MKPALVVLAAGASRRLGVCKASVQLGERSALAHLLRAARPCFEDPPYVIYGPRAASLRFLPGHEARWIYNPHWNLGRTSSLRLIQRLLPMRDLCVAPVDCPLVPRAAFESLLAGWAERGRPQEGWLAPYVPEGGYGHPVILGRELAARLPDLGPDTPLRDLRALARPLDRVEVPHREVLFDLDTPADLEELRHYLACRSED